MNQERIEPWSKLNYLSLPLAAECHGRDDKGAIGQEITLRGCFHGTYYTRWWRVIGMLDGGPFVFTR